jgi:thiamine kinase-like enzyme
LFSNEHIPDLVAADEQRVLLRNLPGEDCYDASPKQMLHMVDRLVDLQWRWHNRLNALFDAGIPSAQSDVLLKCIPDVVNLRLSELSVEHQARLIAFRQTLPERLDRLEACGFPATLVHGDYHPGNWRGAGMDLSILDWGDCCVGHPLLDLPALIDRAGEHAPKLLSHWQQAWQTRLPDADIETAIHLLTPVAYARMAAVYQHFLENIEPAERVFHERDPAIALEKAANALPEA